MQTEPSGSIAVDVDLLMFVVRYHAGHGYGPSVRDLAEAKGRSTSTIHTALARLERAGLVVRDGRAGERRGSRTLRPLVREVPGPWLAA
ncbi:MAG TPA: MarR family transcriptional regulator [Acidimicrobiales bacterium]